MKRISFNPRFVNEVGDDLIPGKIHTIRENYEYWKRFEGQEVALFTWEGKPYRGMQRIFCVKRIVSVQEIAFCFDGENTWFTNSGYTKVFPTRKMAKNDGFDDWRDFIKWFANYKPGKMAIIHFTDYRY